MSDLEICRLAYEGDLRALTEQVEADKSIINKLDKVKKIVVKLLPGRRIQEKFPYDLWWRHHFFIRYEMI